MLPVNTLAEMELLTITCVFIALGFGRGCLPHQPDSFLGHSKPSVEVSDEAIKRESGDNFVGRGHIFWGHDDVEFLTGDRENERLSCVSKVAAM